ncbi:response regulator [Persicobacter psychrovividus]|uniref:Response regulatory domain-containing protein n=1 Tax=Persicobacter psychrovividus TaxID=387638 RepID=A0ABM7VE66_9BACT|nr:hypothetical protein PEPS_15300 [Persicobacter psychrovividus]
MATFNNIILVDDDVVSNYICDRIMSRNNYVATLNAFSNPVEALGFLKEIVDKRLWNLLPQVLMLDLQMPQMDGWAFLDKLSALDPLMHEKMYIVILSSSIFSEDMDRANEHPMVRQYFSKPIRPDILESIHLNLENTRMV